MSPLLLLVAVSTLGIEAGWEPLPEGGHVYTLQIEPQLLDVLKQANEEIVSEVPAQVHIRRFALVVGTGKLPRVDGPPQSPPADSHATLNLPPPPDAVVEQQTPPVDRQAAGSPAGRRSTTEQQPTDARTHLPVNTPEAPADPRRGAAPDWRTADNNGQSPTNAGEPPHLPELDHGSPRSGAQRAGFETKANKVSTSGSKRSKHVTEEDPDAEEASEPAPSRPWTLFVVVLVLLCCSLAANVFLGLVARDARVRYREALTRFRTATAS